MPEPSAAERFAAAKRRTRTPVLNAFREGLGFELDPFQIAACESLEAGRSVLVAAPTGAGKTIVAEFAIFRAMQGQDDKVFYTTPMKALSNQKFGELVATYGADAVGLLTGDTNVNSGARIVVMTTEVLRNMLYADSDLLRGLACVVMDEVHYLADRARGAVWEEVIIHLPEQVRMVSLSATVSNAEEFGDWLLAVRGDTDVIVSEERPVPLDQHVLVRHRLIDLFEDPGAVAAGRAARVNPELVEAARGGSRRVGPHSRYDRGGGDRRRPGPGVGRLDDRVPRPEVVRILGERNLLPAIVFVFSRKGCEQAVEQLVRDGVRLTTAEEREEIRNLAEERCRSLPDEDLGVLGYWDWVSALERGVAAHHAGLLPAFKEVVETLYQRKLVKVVYATETLALGINMPARTVVLESLEKFNGEARVPITAGEYTQLTGRAGRRGIDVEGHSVIVWQPGVDPAAVASLASRRTYPLNSSFRPTYNMAANLVDQFGRERAREILESSFAQFQADRAVVDIARRVRSQQESLAGYATSMECHLGDFREYSGIRRELTDLERKKVDANGSRAERDKRQRRLDGLRQQLKRHPCHACPDREAHARWSERYWQLKKATEQLQRQIESRTGAVARVFDRVTEVLIELTYAVPATGRDDLELTPDGRRLKRIYGERDLLVAECLRLGLWNGLDPAGLAAMATVLVYEPRREGGSEYGMRLPGGRVLAEAIDRTTDRWAELDDIERAHRLDGSGPLSVALVPAMHRWARGGTLDAVLRETDLAPGDFVRWSRQTIDLIDQVGKVADGPVARTARQAVDAIRRGVVASVDF
ncbi:MAG TPA: DEAD/DEAH box helicase [Microbacteriaceae bacterium]|nr:DEAD/DEAH box helicase [Microbacteriaceae bacterium]